MYCIYRAAFQYGVKMADGRKTRRAGPKDEKAQLDRQWQKIQNIIQKRKTMGGSGGGGGGKHAKYEWARDVFVGTCYNVCTSHQGERQDVVPTQFLHHSSPYHT